jgi:hypothetical protein
MEEEWPDACEACGAEEEWLHTSSTLPGVHAGGTYRCRLVCDECLPPEERAAHAATT